MVIVKTPLRVSFFGGGTDYAVWFRERGGAVLATSIDKYIYTQCRILPPFHDHKHRIIYSKIEDVLTIDQIVHPAVREIFRFMSVQEGIELHHSSDLPARSGMGSSSCFTVGLLHAIYALRNQKASHEKLAKEAIYVEQELIKENVGCQDQVMASFGGFNHVKFNQDGSFAVSPIKIKESRLLDLQNHLMLFYTGIQRVASNVASEQIKNTPNRTDELMAMQQMVQAGVEILTGNSSLDDFGRLLHESWQLKRKLSSKISNPKIDEIYSMGMEAGAIGGKLLGAGNGGFVLLYVPPEKQAQVSMYLKNVLPVKFSFENQGSQLIFSRKDETR